MARVNFVIACWGGRRRIDDPEYHDADRGIYIRRSVKALALLKHDLAQVTFANNICEDAPVAYTEALADIPADIHGTPTAYVEKPNWGMSYALWDFAYKQEQGTFDYYLFNEDDQVYMLDNFDSRLVELYESLPDCGCLCGHVSAGHPAIACMLIGADVLAKIVSVYGSLPCDGNPTGGGNYGATEDLGQRAWGKVLTELGYKMYDIRDHFNISFMRFDRVEIYPFGEDNGHPYLVGPQQLINKFRPDWGMK